MLSGMLAGFIIICLGLIVAFAFFAMLGLFAPADVLWLTIAMGVLAAAALIHSLLVRHELGKGGRNHVARSVNALRERRGF
jgi:membrane protein YdbS with pleckstrin-like domain